MIKSEQLIFEELHPFLQFVFGYGGEVSYLMQTRLRNCANNRLAIDIVDETHLVKTGYREDAGWPILREIDKKTGEERVHTVKLPVYEEVPRLVVHIGIDSSNEIVHENGLEFVVESEKAGLAQVEVLRQQLRGLYNLRYGPGIYRNGQLLQNAV